MLPKLPLDLSTFRELRESQYLYVDKTKYAYDLITGGRRYFLSRPRRFGKSLFVSTLKEILSAKKEFFEGLWIASSDYNWRLHGVIALDFSSLGITNLETLKRGICEALEETAFAYGLKIEMSPMSPELSLRILVRALHEKFGRVAVLIDEYDNPILASLKDQNRAIEIRDGLRHFFATIKSLDEYVTFAFITGVSSFAKAGLFSGMNNLQIITLNERFAGACGYLEEEIDLYFIRHIQTWAEKEKSTYDELRKRIKNWYNGYHFGKDVPAVYNPFSLMHALHAQEFKNFWFQSGAPTFLIEELRKEVRKNEYEILDPEEYEMTEDSLGIFEIGATPLPTLMFQAGYLTIAGYNKDFNLYKLGYPNFEVKSALQKYMLGVFAQLDSFSAEQISLKLAMMLDREKIEEAMVLTKQLFANIPYQLQMKEEKFYHALMQMMCNTAGIKAQSEYSTSHGRIDLVLDLPHVLYVIEIKFNESAEIALAQIEERRYYESFMMRGKSILLLGLSFKREPTAFDVSYAIKRVD